MLVRKIRVLIYCGTQSAIAERKRLREHSPNFEVIYSIYGNSASEWFIIHKIYIALWVAPGTFFGVGEQEATRTNRNTTLEVSLNNPGSVWLQCFCWRGEEGGVEASMFVSAVLEQKSSLVGCYVRNHGLEALSPLKLVRSVVEKRLLCFLTK